MNIQLLETLLARAAQPLVGETDAGSFSRLCVDTHIMKFPRMNPLQEAVNDLTSWQAHEAARPGDRPQAVVDRKSVQVLDFKGLPPSLMVGTVHESLEKKARNNGLAAAGFYNTGGIVTLGMWANGLARRDLIGMAMFNGGCACAVPFGARKGVLGTNPLCYAVPTENDPLYMDMATTKIPFFEVKNAKEAGTALDGEGLPTTDPALALEDEGTAHLLPMGGGIKGYGIMMLIEILTGSLVRSLLSTEQQPGWHPHEYGCLILAIDIAAFTELSTFKSSISRMCDDLRAMPPAPGAAQVLIPGDRGNEKIRQARESGEIEVDPELVKALEDAASQAD